MKSLEVRIREASSAAGVGQSVVERDYAQGYVLLGLASSVALGSTLVFKGGTALKKVHVGTYRFSEDLDFSAVQCPKGVDLENEIRSAIDAAEAFARQHSDVRVTVERYEERDPHPGGQEAFIVRFRFQWQGRPMVPVKLEVTHDEPVLLQAPARPIVHGYGESLEAEVRTYCLEEICAEKLRSIRQTQARLAERGWARSRARDFYDLWHLSSLAPGSIDWAQVSGILPLKCSLRGVKISSVDDVFEPALVDEVRATWHRTLGPFVTELPDVGKVIEETHNRLSELLIL